MRSACTPEVAEMIKSRYPTEGGRKISEETGIPRVIVNEIANDLGVKLEDRDGEITCRSCGVRKPLGEFYEGRRVCKECKTKRSLNTARRNRIMVSEQKCNSCGLMLSADNFNASSLNVSGLQAQCKECTKVSKRVSRYGMSKEEYEDMLKEQNKTCPICKKELKRPVVDHCHKTGKVRSILCNTCNSGIGYLGDDYLTVTRAASYLYSHENYWCPQ